MGEIVSLMDGLPEYYKNLSLENIHFINDEGIVCVERWKDIADYEGYQISCLGRVKTLSKQLNSSLHPFIVRKEKILKQSICKGYLQVTLTIGKRKTLNVHRLVGIAFVENPLNLKEINHKKGIKIDNRFWQIEWSTRSKNVKHSFEELGRKMKKGSDCPLSKSILCNQTGKTYGGISEASRKLKLSVGNISSVLNGKRNHTGGLTFSFI